MLFKGPTGCGKTRFIEFMSYRLGQPLTQVRQKSASGKDGQEGLARDHLPLITIACHEDLTASDLVGRYLLEGDETVWIDGPLSRAVKVGGICYLDEIVEARKDTTVIIHPLDRPPAHSSRRKAGRATGGRRGISAGPLLQPRLSERP